MKKYSVSCATVYALALTLLACMHFFYIWRIELHYLDSKASFLQVSALSDFFFTIFQYSDPDCGAFLLYVTTRILLRSSKIMKEFKKLFNEFSSLIMISYSMIKDARNDYKLCLDTIELNIPRFEIWELK